jgi:hypothetical protein
VNTAVSESAWAAEDIRKRATDKIDILREKLNGGLVEVHDESLNTTMVLTTTQAKDLRTELDRLLKQENQVMMGKGIPSILNPSLAQPPQGQPLAPGAVRTQNVAKLTEGQLTEIREARATFQKVVGLLKNPPSQLGKADIAKEIQETQQQLIKSLFDETVIKTKRTDVSTKRTPPPLSMDSFKANDLPELKPRPDGRNAVESPATLWKLGALAAIQQQVEKNKKSKDGLLKAMDQKYLNGLLSSGGAIDKPQETVGSSDPRIRVQEAQHEIRRRIGAERR